MTPSNGIGSETDELDGAEGESSLARSQPRSGFRRMSLDLIRWPSTPVFIVISVALDPQRLRLRSSVFRGARRSAPWAKILGDLLARLAGECR
jgi:hypothetical protein